ncbi:MAG: hypothetical protein JW939_05030 [Candidatus Thermoplasmatota archaeon]|nr:hypothetical protein [Candidatus Thermoplasmatota archaeon]
MERSAMIFVMVSGLLLLFLPFEASGSEENLIDIEISYIGDLEDRNEWGSLPGGDHVRAEWGELVSIKAYPQVPFNRSVVLMWNITNIRDGNSTVYRGGEIEVRFQPSNRRLDTPQSEKFLVRVYLWVVGTGEVKSGSSIQLWVWSDDDDDNDGLPDKRERYYWGEDIIHHRPEYDEDGDGLTNAQEIGFHIPLSEAERSIPYYPFGGPFDPTHPNDPISRNVGYNGTGSREPDGPVMSDLAAYSILGCLASLPLLEILFIILYVRYRLKDDHHHKKKEPNPIPRVSDPPLPHLPYCLVIVHRKWSTRR